MSRIVVIGGGTGSFTLLQSLKTLTSKLTAIVNMCDDGGSTGILRDELGVLPPGDARQCLVALSESPEIRDLFDYRFSDGRLEGQSLGNIILSGLELQHGSFEKAVEVASKILIQKLKSQIFNVQGGLMEWKAKGFSTITNTKRVPIMRQVFIAASLLLWLGLLGFYVVGAWGLLLVAIVASGLLISGVTGWCGMAFLLAKMPWNRL